QRGWRAPPWPRCTLGTSTLDRTVRLVRRHSMQLARSLSGPSASRSPQTFIGSWREHTLSARRSSRFPFGQSSLLFRRFLEHVPSRPCWLAFLGVLSRAAWADVKG